MKKKVIIISLSLMFVMIGVVSAAANWGKFEGYNVVKLVIDGKEVVVKDTPPVILKDRTMVPLSLLDQVGLTYEWNPDTYTVNVESNQNISSSYQDPVDITKEIISYGGGGLTLINIENDMTALVYFEQKSNFDNDWFMLDNIFKTLTKVDSIYSRIEYGYNNITQAVIEIKTKDYINFLNGNINEQELQELWIVSGPLFELEVQPPPVIDMPFIEPGFSSGTVTSKIKDTFEGFDEGNLYELDNGQIWKQTSFDYKYAYKYRPEVIIYKDGIHWYMSVEGVDKKVKVEKLK